MFSNLEKENEELEKEKCELLGLIQAKDKLIEKMKNCSNCRYSCNFLEKERPCTECTNGDKWELDERLINIGS